MCEHLLTTENTVSAVVALRDALDELDRVFAAIDETYQKSLETSGIEREAELPSTVPRRAEFQA